MLLAPHDEGACAAKLQESFQLHLSHAPCSLVLLSLSRGCWVESELSRAHICHASKGYLILTHHNFSNAFGVAERQYVASKERLTLIHAPGRAVCTA